MTKLRTIPRNWLVGEWLLDGNALDTNDGTKNKGAASNVTYTNTDVGMQYKCGVFNGESAWVTATSTDISTWFTTTLWVKTNTNTASNTRYYLFNSAWSTDNGSIFQFWSTFKGGVLIWTSCYYVDWATAISTWVWYHLTVTYSSTNKLRIFVNWVLDWTNTWMSWDPSSTTGTWYIWRSSTWDYLSGNLQTVRVYNRELSQDEIYSLYLEWKKKLSGASYSWLMDWLVAQFESYWDTVLYNVSNSTTATRVGGTATNDNFWSPRAISNPNYTWSSITYTTGYTFENSGSGWWIVTSPTWLSATWINRTTTLKSIYLFNRTLSAWEVTTLWNLCSSQSNVYPF